MFSTCTRNSSNNQWTLWLLPAEFHNSSQKGALSSSNTHGKAKTNKNPEATFCWITAFFSTIVHAFQHAPCQFHRSSFPEHSAWCDTLHRWAACRHTQCRCAPSSQNGRPHLDQPIHNTALHSPWLLCSEQQQQRRNTALVCYKCHELTNTEKKTSTGERE